MRPRFHRTAAALGLGALVLAVNGASAEETPESWFQNGKNAVLAAKQQKPNRKKAKNVILFVGDGMGISTLTASRIFEGQQLGGPGEDHLLFFESFPHVSLSRTYQVNQQTPDSAPTMTAMVTGVKTDEGVLSVNQDVVHDDYTTVAGTELETILEKCEKKGMSTGIVSTARITHATPAACYAHTCNRDWENDGNLPTDAKDADFKDIARQLLEFPHGDGLEVALGGGRSNFIPNTTADPEDGGKFGSRKDGRDLTAEWTSQYSRSSFVWNRTQFDSVDPATTDHLLGLFERSHMEYEVDREADAGGEPSLTDMTEKAIQVLQRNKKGFFLHVEAGRIDHAHHAGNAYRALTDTVELARAVRKAWEMTDPRNTLIIVTADHSHVFTIAGYPTRGNPILGLVKENENDGTAATSPALDMLGLPYTTLGYANGPGYTGASNAQGEGIKTSPHFPSTYSGISSGRPDLSAVDTGGANFMQEATVPLSSETHAAEDVGIYASGPSAYLFQGVVEQNVIYHVMANALRLD